MYIKCSFDIYINLKKQKEHEYQKCLDPVSVEFPVQISLLMKKFYQTNLVHNQMIFINECRDKEQDTREGGVGESRLDKGEVGVT